MKTNQPSSDCSQTDIINWLRVPLIILVIYIHSNWGVLFEFKKASPMAMFSTNFMDYVETITASIAVPLFFFISGYLFFLNVRAFNKAIYLYKIRRRIKSLLIPYISWNTIFIVWTFITVMISLVLKHESIILGIVEYIKKFDYLGAYWAYGNLEEPLNAFGFVRLGSAPLDGPLWYVRNLMVVCLISPIIWTFIKFIPFVYLSLCGLMFLTGIFPVFPGLNAVTLAFFSFGAYFSIHNKDFVALTWSKRWWMWGATILVGAILAVLFNNKDIQSFRPLFKYMTKI